MRIGDRLYCKKSISGLSMNNYPYCIFTEGYYYKVVNMFDIGEGEMLDIIDNDFRGVVFDYVNSEGNYLYWRNYFCTVQEVRKIKLERIILYE